jgi:hypothetical protein
VILGFSETVYGRLIALVAPKEIGMARTGEKWLAVVAFVVVTLFAVALFHLR